MSQNYKNHRRLVPGFHFVVYPLLFAALGGEIWFIKRFWGDWNDVAWVIMLAIICSTIASIFITYHCRHFALKAQDRAIRAEENLRHFALTGKLLDKRITMGQAIALRFASDDEFVALAQRAANVGMRPDEIKRSITNWREDNYRV
jgi:hypothetical protein